MKKKTEVMIIGCVFDALRGEKKEYFSKALQFPEGFALEQKRLCFRQVKRGRQDEICTGGEKG